MGADFYRRQPPEQRSRGEPSHDCGLFLIRSGRRRRDRKHAAATGFVSRIPFAAAPAKSHAMDILWQYQFRIILLGDSTVGKSSLLKRFTDGIYSDVADPTVGVDFYARSLDIEPGVKIKLQLWDTAGQERFRYNTRQKNDAASSVFLRPFWDLSSNLREASA